MEIRLLGGSWHSKRMAQPARSNTIYLQKFVKKNRRLRWSPDLINLDTAFTIEHEVYERRMMRKITPIDDLRWLVEIREAYIKKGSKIKDETFWKLGMHAETREEMMWLGKT